MIVFVGETGRRKWQPFWPFAAYVARTFKSMLMDCSCALSGEIPC